jgi:hypothetical protein
LLAAAAGRIRKLLPVRQAGVVGTKMALTSAIGATRSDIGHGLKMPEIVHM